MSTRKKPSDTVVSSEKSFKISDLQTAKISAAKIASKEEPQQQDPALPQSLGFPHLESILEQHGSIDYVRQSLQNLQQSIEELPIQASKVSSHKMRLDKQQACQAIELSIQMLNYLQQIKIDAEAQMAQNNTGARS